MPFPDDELKQWKENILAKPESEDRTKALALIARLEASETYAKARESGNRDLFLAAYDVWREAAGK